MKVFEFIEVVAVFHTYMMHGNTGDAATFAGKLGISRATLYRLMDELEDYGIHIEYSRERQTYHYLYPDRVQIHISICELPEEKFENFVPDVRLSVNCQRKVNSFAIQK